MNNSMQLPNDDQVERAVLSGYLMGTEDFLNHSDIKADLFFNRNNRMIFDVIAQMALKNEKVDLVTVTSKIVSLGIVEETGGIGYISSLLKSGCKHSPLQYSFILQEKFKLRKLIELADKTTVSAYGEFNSTDLINDIQKKTFELQLENESENLLETASDENLKIVEMKMRGEKVIGLSTSIDPWDRVLGGLNSRFYVLAARAAKGKTAMMEQMVTKLLLNNNSVLVFEKDMSAEMFIMRMSCRAAEVPFTKFDVGNCSPQELESIKKAIQFFRKSPLKLYSPSGFTIANFASIVKKEKRLNDIKAVFLDHILNLDVGSEYRTGLTQASTRIRQSVEENKIPHVILAQLNRGAHNCERPTPAHIKEFDALYADCDAMIMLWSEKETQDLQPGELQPIKFTVNKNRYGTEFEDCLGFDRPLMKFKTMRN